MSINLRSPNLGNEESLDLQKIIRTTRGGETIVFRDEIWPQTITIKYSFDTLKSEEVNALKSFIIESLGQLVTLTDHEELVQTGIILTTELEVQENSRFCDFSTSFDFLVL